jgi:hypothetical protein
MSISNFVSKIERSIKVDLRLNYNCNRLAPETTGESCGRLLSVNERKLSEMGF